MAGQGEAAEYFVGMHLSAASLGMGNVSPIDQKDIVTHLYS
jgi:hypothetical protein